MVWTFSHNIKSIIDGNNLYLKLKNGIYTKCVNKLITFLKASPGYQRILILFDVKKILID